MFKRQLLMNAFRAADAVVMAAAFAVAMFMSSQWEGASFHDFLAVRIKVSNIILFLCFIALWQVILHVQGLYRSHRIGRMRTEWWQVTKAVLLAVVGLAAMALLFRISAIGRVFLTVFLFTVLPLTLLMRTALRFALGFAREHGRNLRNAVIVGCGRRGAAIGRELWNRPELGYLIVGYIDDIPAPRNNRHSGSEKLLGGLAEIERLLQNEEVDEVFIALPVKSYYETIDRVITLCIDLGLLVRIPADSFQSRFATANIDYLDDSAFLTLGPVKESTSGQVTKRVVDAVASGLAILALLPVFAVIAIAVKLDSRGPVFFVQDRVGLGRKRFRMVKFRTMFTDAETRLEELEAQNEVRGAAFKMRNDPRVTRVGRMLRKLSLDELPQFFNVLVGDMSFVGPRPLPVRDFERFHEQWQKRRFSVKPGLTCLWQVHGRHEISFEHWMELDLQYIDNWSLKLDFEILLKTIPAVLRGSGAS